MSGSVVLETGIGLAFVFFTASLVCTGVLEGIANKLNKRGDYLLRGLREMLDLPPATPGAADNGGHGKDIETTGLAGKNRKNRRSELQRLADAGEKLSGTLVTSATTARQRGAKESTVAWPDALADLVLAHPVVAALHRPARPGQRGGRIHLTSYLSGRTFAAILIDLLVPNGAGQTTVDELRELVEQLPRDVPARGLLLALLRDAGSSVDSFRHSLEGWYDEQMGRVSGWYKRWAQFRLLGAGLVLAVLVNIDTFHIGHVLYHDQPVREVVVAQAVSAQGCPDTPGPGRDDCLADQKRVLRELTLPLGWDLAAAGSDCAAYSGGRSCGLNPLRWVPFAGHSATEHGAASLLLKLLGWLLTGLAVSLGAPFWFDALGKLGSLRTAGRRPAESTPVTTPPAPPDATTPASAGLSARTGLLAEAPTQDHDVGSVGRVISLLSRRRRR